MSSKQDSNRRGRPIKQPLPAWVYGASFFVLILLCIGLLWLFRPQGMDKAVMFLVYTVIALIAALALFGFMRSYAWKKTDVTKKDGKGNKKRVMKEYGGPVLLFILLLGVALKWGTETEPFSFAIFLRDAKVQRVSIESGSVFLSLDNVSKKAEIDSDGRANFEGIPAGFRDKEVKVELVAPGWIFNKGTTTTCTLRGNSATLTVKRERGLGSVSGRVIDMQGNVIQGAAVTIRDISTSTDANGWFKLVIPPGKQAEQQSLVIRKEGFKTKSLLVYPGKDQAGLRIPLEKE